MSMEMHVLSDVVLPSLEAWQQAIDARGFRVRLSAERALAELRGALPVLLDDQLTAFECDHCDAAEVMTETPDIAFDRSWKHALAFRWGADLSAWVAACIAAACYAEASEGVVLEDQEGRILTPQQAIAMARVNQQQMPSIEAAIAKAVARFRH
jgi:hypothetical protein